MTQRYVSQVRVRWSDLDAFGHVNNARTLTLLEEARVDWLFRDAAQHGVDRLTQGVVVAHLEIDYTRAIGYDLPVTVSMGITAMRNASFTIDYQVTVGGATAARASTVMVAVDPTTFRPRRLDERERAFLERYLVA
ncbi:acyl-CoA thioesterase [Nakamurella flavida]|uniref:Acyl-CoA thioesterase n=1 Tax=Nakamurella flavida TaxID=363630 RepID=A0A938YPR9_9ACTN|nr:thioesterase family protein [Nakamurella flavida]MBM9477237.1 acyl-CoA thioesterase [Nakamurella flavida]MDP9776379.1 acyl-CoA thioester hydrolase [Nakamurella flavida]